MLFDAMTQAFRVLGGVPQRGIFDNMKTAVDRIGTGKARQINARFAAMASHYLFEPEFCNPASGWEKGQVEKNVQDARHRLWQLMPSFPDIDALNALARGTMHRAVEQDPAWRLAPALSPMCMRRRWAA
jgi:transposase